MLSAWCSLWWGCMCAEQRAATQQRCGSSAVGEETEVPDADQALGQDVDEEASQELVRRDGHDLLLAACGVVLPAEGDSVLLEGDKTMVGDGDAVSVASQVMENMLCSAERWLGIDDPLLG